MHKTYIEREAAMPPMICIGISCQECPFYDSPMHGGCKVAEFIVDIPAADVVELPCRIGDTVWCIRSFRGIDHPQETKVSGMYFTQDMRLNIQCKYVGTGEFGKKVFKTREDAMKAMEGQRA